MYNFQRIEQTCNELSIEMLQEMAKNLSCEFSEEETIILESVLRTLENKMVASGMEKEFIKFCDQL